MEALYLQNGEANMKTYHYTRSGLDNIWLINGFEIHETPYGKGVSVQDVEGLHKVIGKAIIAKSGRITGKECRFLRIGLEMSQKRIGELVGKDAQTIARWEKSDELNQDADFVVRHIYQQTVINRHANYEEMVDDLNNLDRESFKTEFQRTDEGWFNTG